MPNHDGTGPKGDGAATGKRRGNCRRSSDENSTENRGGFFGLGKGRGRGRGQGKGNKNGHGNGQGHCHTGNNE